MAPLTLSVIIPTLDEEKLLGARLEELGRIAPEEVIVADGGSADRTLEVARSFGAVRIVAAPRGRGAQMNAGASAACGDVLLFLHADVALPADARRWIEETLRDADVVAGAFRTWTVPDGGRPWLAPLLHLADARSRITRLPYGDQALFVRAAAFRKVGGFPEEPILEDLELSRRLRRMGDIRIVPARVRVSGRRFLARPVFYTLLANIYPVLSRLGISPRLLARWYGHVR